MLSGYMRTYAMEHFDPAELERAQIVIFEALTCQCILARRDVLDVARQVKPWQAFLTFNTSFRASMHWHT